MNGYHKKQTNEITHEGDDMEKKEHLCTVDKIVHYIPITMENSLEVPQNIKNRTTIYPAIPPLRIYPKETKILCQINICTPMFTAALFTIAKTQKQPKCPVTDEWIDKLWDIYTMEYYLAIKKKEILPLATSWMGL